MEPIYPLPTFDSLGVPAPPSDTDALKIATEWLELFSNLVAVRDVEGIMSLFLPISHWRDMLALTWDFRTFNGAQIIRRFLVDRLSHVRPTEFRITHPEYTRLLTPYPDISWVQAHFTFNTPIGACSGVLRLVPQPDGIPWKVHCIYTNLEDLKGHPELIGTLRNPAPNHGKWSAERAAERAFENVDPTVLVIGAGHSGLDIAARLKYLGIPTLVVEKNARVGDNWRNRYEALCLHDPVWYDHMPYLPFPPTWPVYTPALKLANWLENYAEALEIDVWTNTIVLGALQDPASCMWNVDVETTSGMKRTFMVKHIIFATGLGDRQSKIPFYPGMEKYKGEIKRSVDHRRAEDHAGKRVLVVGAGTSGHDIAADYAIHGIDVTLYQRSSTYVMNAESFRHVLKGMYAEGAPPTDVSDRVSASFPHLMSIGLGQRQALKIATDDKVLLDQLRESGFKINMGFMDAGFSLLARNRAGGYYLNVGASEMIINGKIKLKNDSPIAEFTESGLRFKNGSQLLADVVIFATGVGDPRDVIRTICGDNVGDRCGKIWGLDAEGELQGVWRDLGVPGLWYMLGNLALGRFHSKHLAMQIKAIETGIFDGRYSEPIGEQ
ncbi:hypothetical protein B0H17DRAFT_1075373 [Mycena rosella]|uniref:Flavin-containing monooxygenase n=1 Tax=Mycena rosella TaxID=1033263 RepID=A0AAD7D710_MYCRO|nr:hypothetical protein B0H17DRAFT_1075373 [Mycena rosella]